MFDDYYADRPKAAIVDGWLSFDWRHPIGSLVGEINAILGGSPLLTLLSVAEDSTRSGHAIVTVRARDGNQAKRSMENSEDILPMANTRRHLKG
jgi:hypothetical protein